MKIIITVNIIAKIGGIETWLYNMSQNLCNDYNILILYEVGDALQLKRLSELVNIERMNKNRTYDCDVCILGSTITPYYNNIKASKYIQVVHADYSVISKEFFIKRNIPGLEYVTVSQSCKKSLLKEFGIMSKVIENPMGKIKPVRRTLKLLSCTRLTEEKGYWRMLKLIRILKENDIPFEWKIFTQIDEEDKIEDPSIIYMKPTLDIAQYINDCDYGVQLSDTESFCYFIHECLQYKKPVLITDLPCMSTSGFIDGEHGYIFDFDMKNIDINKVYNEIPKCEKELMNYYSIDKWKNILGKSNEKTKIIDTFVKIKVTKEYYDMYFNRDIKINEILTVPEYRASDLCDVHKLAIRMI